MMPRNKVYAIVEGHGEANSPALGELPAVYILIQKMLSEHGCYTLFPPARRNPWRLRGCGDFDAANILEKTIRAHQAYDDCAAVLVLRDLDDGCAAQVGPAMAERVRNMGALPFSVTIVCAVREYEAWFLASLETIHPGQVYPGQAESIRGAKGWLAREYGYREVEHQSHYTRLLDATTIIINNRSRSFERLYHAFGQIVQASNNLQSVITP